MHKRNAAASIQGSIKQDCQKFKFSKLAGEIFDTSRVFHPYGKSKMAKYLMFLTSVILNVT